MKILAISNDLSEIKEDVKKYFRKHLLYKRHCKIGYSTIKILHYDTCELNKIFEAHNDEIEVLNEVDESGRTFVELDNIREAIYEFAGFGENLHKHICREVKLYAAMYLLVRKLAWYEYDIDIHVRFIDDFNMLTNVALELDLFTREK